MKKYFYSVLAASMLFACSQEDIVDITKGEGQKVTFTVEIPSVESRTVNGATIGDGSKANKLIYAMYENGGDATTPLIKGVVYDGEGNEDDGKFTVSVPMAKDLTYDLLFFAYNEENCAFKIDEGHPENTNLKKLEFKQNQTANNDAFDAFVGYLESQGVTANPSTSIPLRRPFAQVNAATTKKDMEGIKMLNYEVNSSELVVKNVPQYYNVFKGIASSEEKIDVTFKAEDILRRDRYENESEVEYPYNEILTVDNENYYYLTLAYVLAGGVEKESTHDATFTFYRKDGKNVSTLNIPNLPIQRNYRTNIVGNLLTKFEDYEIVIDARFEEPDHIVPMDKYEVSTINELQAAINRAADGVPTTITLKNDIEDENGDGIQDSRATEGTYWVTVPNTKDIIIDLNGKTISQTFKQTGKYSMLLNEGKLTINDTSDEKSGKISYTDNGNGGEYISDAIYNCGVLVINGGTIENLSSETVATNGYPHAVDTYSGSRNTSVTINGGTIHCAEYSAIRMFCVSATYKADLVINGGTIKGAIDMQNGSKDAALGILIINDGTFETTKNPNNIRFANWNSGATEYGITAAIKGGSFEGGITTAYVPEAANWNKGIVSGGIWGVDVTDYVAEGCLCVKIEDNKYQVVKGISLKDEQ